MKCRKIMASFLAIILIFTWQISAFADTEGSGSPDIQFASAASLLMNMETGKIYHARNIDEKLYPASTTKIMTAILALENGNLTDVLVASDAAIALPPGTSNIGILRGEEITLNEHMYALLLASANDSANVIAEHIAGSIVGFVEMMNTKAKELGALSTHFSNTNGLHDEEHYTTARDLATITKYAMSIPAFREYVKTEKYVMPPTNKYKKERYLNSTNRLMSNNKKPNYIYKNAVGIKTGFTTPAQHCLVAGADNGEFSLLSVVLGAPLEAETNVDLSYMETVALFDWGFDSFTYQSIVKTGEVLSEVKIDLAKGKDVVTLASNKEIISILPKAFDKTALKSEFKIEKIVTAPVKKGDILGSLTYSYDGEELGTVYLTATDNVERDEFAYTMRRIQNFVKKPLFYIPVAVVVLLIILLYIIRLKNISKKRRSRQFTMRSSNYKRNSR